MVTTCRCCASCTARNGGHNVTKIFIAGKSTADALNTDVKELSEAGAAAVYLLAMTKTRTRS